jgi:hypothetical protein
MFADVMMPSFVPLLLLLPFEAMFLALVPSQEFQCPTDHLK